MGTSPGPRSRSKTMSKKATTPAKASSKSKPEQPAKDKPAKAKPERTPSNKERVYRQWEKASEKSPKEAEALMAKAKVTEVKLTTVRGWISSWNNGANLPGCAKE